MLSQWLLKKALSPWQAGHKAHPTGLQKTCVVCWASRIVHLFQNHRETAQALSISVLNACVVAGQIFPRIPRWLPNGAQTALAYTGVLWVPTMAFHICDHTAPLIRDSYRDRNYIRLSITCTKLVQEILGIVFTVGGFLVSSTALAGYPKLRQQWYAKTQPLGLACAISGVVINIFDTIAACAYQETTRRIHLRQRCGLLRRIKDSGLPQRPISPAMVAADYAQNVYVNYLKPVLDPTLYHFDFGLRVDAYFQTLIEQREARLADRPPIPCRSQLRGLVNPWIWSRWERSLRRTPSEGTKTSVFSALKKYFRVGDSLTGGRFALRCFDYCAFKAATAYPRSRHGWMLASSVLHTLERWFCSHRSEQHSREIQLEN